MPVDGAALASNSFVGLYTSDANDNIVPALADGMPIVSEDGTQYTINLKTWQKWSNGDPLTAEDFVYSWKRAADPNTASDLTRTPLLTTVTCSTSSRRTTRARSWSRTMAMTRSSSR